MLRAFIGYETNRKDGRNVGGTMSSSSRLDANVATLMLCFVKREKHGGKQYKEYGNTLARMVETVRRQLTGIGKEFLKHWYLDEVTIQEGGLSTGERKRAVREMSRSATNVWTLPST